MRRLPPVTKNLLIITFLCWFADYVLQARGIHLVNLFGLHYFSASDFHFWQPVTYMFMHANFSHIFFNMFAVLMFAPALEQQWGSNRFLIYFLVCGVGAAVAQQTVWAFMYEDKLNQIIAFHGLQAAAQYINPLITIGASGAVFGILFAFAWLFPNVEMFLFFIPIPIRARVMVIAYALIELFLGLVPMNGDNVAHFAHLGGMLFGWLLLLWWRRDNAAQFSSQHLADTSFTLWLKQQWRRFVQWLRNIFRRPPHIRSNKSATQKRSGYDNYHYHEPLKFVSAGILSRRISQVISALSYVSRSGK